MPPAATALAPSQVALWAASSSTAPAAKEFAPHTLFKRLLRNGAVVRAEAREDPREKTPFFERNPSVSGSFCSCCTAFCLSLPPIRPLFGATATSLCPLPLAVWEVLAPAACPAASPTLASALFSLKERLQSIEQKLFGSRLRQRPCLERHTMKSMWPQPLCALSSLVVRP